MRTRTPAWMMNALSSISPSTPPTALPLS
jgi:hypothetical protein